MGWSFRRRIKITPGVHLNLSRHGVSASFGRRGASVTLGTRGAFLHTGFPGTGIYYRQKIGSKKRKKKQSYNSKLYTSSVFSSKHNSKSDNSYFDSNNSNQPLIDSKSTSFNSKGCLRVVLWILLVFNLIILIGNTASLIESKEISQPDNWIAIGFFVLICVCCIVFLHRMAKSSSTKMAKYYSGQIERLKNTIEQETNPIKVKILNNRLGDLILNEATSRLNPLIETASKKVSKKPTLKWEQLLQQYENELTAAQEEAGTLHYDIMAELSEEEKDKYSTFCEAFQAFSNSDRVWAIVSEELNLEYKASAKTLVNRKRCRFETGYFNELIIPRNVPIICIFGRQMYFYPRFVIVANSEDEFDVLSIAEIKLKYRSVRFHEEGEFPYDAKKIGETYKYVNNDGSADERYSNNPSIPILLYGELFIEPFEYTFQTSNSKAAMDLKSAFLDLQYACYWHLQEKP